MASHPAFVRRGDILECTLPISLTEAIEGGNAAQFYALDVG